VEKQKIFNITNVRLYSGVGHPACIAHASYCTVICGLCGSTIFFHIISNGTVYGKKVNEHKMCVFIFSTTFLILKRFP